MKHLRTFFFILRSEFTNTCGEVSVFFSFQIVSDVLMHILASDVKMSKHYRSLEIYVEFYVLLEKLDISFHCVTVK